jgi:hypothetical protein
MLRALLESIASKRAPPRVIFDRAGISPYLSRWYLLKGPTMPDGSHPFDPDGSPREGIRDPDRKYAVFLHKFHRGDDDLELHNHPWEWAVAIVLVGGYREERRRGSPEKGGWVFVRNVLPFSVNVIRHDTFHRVELLEKDAWSLFLAGPRAADWGFWNRSTGVFTQWRTFITRKRDPTAFAMPMGRMPTGPGRTVQAIQEFVTGRVCPQPPPSVPRVTWPGSEDGDRDRSHCEPEDALVEAEVYVAADACPLGDDCSVCDGYLREMEHRGIRP